MPNLPSFAPLTNSFTEFPREEIEQSISLRFEQQVQKYPEKLAVITDNYKWTYEQLNQKANRIARIIISLSKTETNIALLFAHDAPMIAAILGSLKAGKTYIPLDPNYPRSRLAYFLNDSLAFALLTDSQNLLLAQNLAQDNLEIINIDNFEYSGNYENLGGEISANTLAYILYTSGSTGQPKGVIQNHRNVLHFIRNYTNNLHISENDRLTLLSSYSFDAAVMAIFGALLNGATLCPFDIRKEGFTNLSQWLIDREITIYHSTPTVFRYFVRSLGETSDFKNIRLVVLGGEEVVKSDVENYKKIFSEKCVLINGFGPTESTVTLQNFIDKQTQNNSWKVPVGYPVENTEILLLDESGNITEEDTGEIAIKSPHVALGYWQKPELTEAVFSQDPVNNNLRVYRTGDWGNRREDGAIEVVGRKDFQAKIRGFRIELTEIEHFLQQYPDIKEAVVMVREDMGNDKIIVAYLVLSCVFDSQRAREQTEPGTIHDRIYLFLKEKLPQYMIPSAFVFMEALPLTPSGKIDRLSLPKPKLSERGGENAFAPPENPREEIIGQIWEEVLAVEKVARDDNFFFLGGHSLLATQVISRLKKALGVEIPLGLIFSAPTVGELAAAIEKIDTGPHMGLPAIEPQPRPESIPLSFAQQRLWFLDQLEGKSSTYNITNVFELRGQLNLEALESALASLSYRQEILRTNFIAADGQPRQCVGEVKTPILEAIDLEDLPAEEKTAAVERLVAENSGYKFALDRDNLVRSQIIFLGEDTYLLLLTLHHLIADDWSMNIFFRELSLLYAANIQGQPSPISPLTIQYADFALWQHQWFSPQFLEPQLNYWRQQLRDLPPLLDLPTDKPRPSVPSFRGATRFFQLPAPLRGRLKEFARRAGATEYMILVMAFALLLSRYSGQKDIALGTVIANRNRGEIESLIGFFANTLVLRLNLEDNPSFVEGVAQARRVALEAYAHQELPFQDLLGALQPQRSSSYHPLFQHMFVWQNAPRQEWQMPGLTVSQRQIDTGHAKFDLTLVMEERGESIVGEWIYSTDLFVGETIDAMLGHFLGLLEAALSAPGTTIENLPLLTQYQKHQLLRQWNCTHTDYPRDCCIHHLFEEQASLYPDAVALVFEGQHLTYSQLNQLSNQLARYLQSLAIGPDTLVGICADRSLEMIVGILGILKAGGAYVPLDPNYPLERLNFMVTDSGIEVLLTQQQLSHLFSEHSINIVYLDEKADIFSRESVDNLIDVVTAENLAYAIYTSGSTGQPKGVLVNHRGLCNLALAQKHLFDVDQKSRILQFASLSFDASVWDIVMALANGASLYLGTRENLLPGEPLERSLKEWGISHVILPPSALAVMSVEEKVPSLKALVVGGEACPVSLMKRWSREYRFFNAYGPTESTVCATIAECFTESDRITIGRPLPNIQIYILDPHLQPVPIGVRGEIYIGGDGLARGYLDRPELTAERFIPNPFGEGRLYRTGDLARYLPDGNIEYLGRIDNQVKLRGFRVELSEIESVLSGYREVRESAVMVREDTPDRQYIAAYIVPSSSAQSTATILTRLRAFLKEKLPQYMIPSAFVFMEALPLTPSGKIDRLSLPKPKLSGRGGENAFAPPENPREEIIGKIWEKVLAVEKVAREDNFFYLGGHSLLATQVISRLKKALGVEIPLGLIFSAPTVGELAAAIEQLDGGPNVGLPAIEPQPRPESIPLSFAQQRLWFLDQLEGKSSTYNITNVFELRGQLNLEALEAALASLSYRQEILRTNFIAADGQPRQCVGEVKSGLLEAIDLEDLPAEEKTAAVERLVAENSGYKFALDRDNLVRSQIIFLGEDTYLLLLTLHHLIADDWSMNIFFRELSVLYAANIQGQPSPILPLTIQYADFALWQHQWFSPQFLEPQLNYWRQQLRDLPPLLDLPTDKPRPSLQSFRGATRFFQLPALLRGRLKEFARRSGATEYMILVTAFAVLLSRYSGQKDIALGTVIANRNRGEIESLIGFFANTLVLRLNLEDNPSFVEGVAQARRVALEAYAHQDLPFQDVLGALRPQRSSSYHPLFQHMFVWQNAPRLEWQMPGLTISQRQIDTGRAKFDITLVMEERGESIVGEWIYSTDLFVAETIERMLAHFQCLLEAALSHPEARVETLPMLTQSEKYRLLRQWNCTHTDYPRDFCIHHLFEEQVSLAPDAVALVFEGQHLTYAQLNQLSNQLAHYLRDRGVKPEVLVGLCLKRSLDLIVGILGILKAGGAYLPLDPDYPSERLAFILEDTGVKIILSQDSLLDKLPDSGLDIICLDSDRATIQLQKDNNPISEATADNLAYVIYTSGTTGNPKGVCVIHRGVTRLVKGNNYARLNEEEIFLQLAPITFDAATFEIWGSLLNGARLVLFPGDKPSVAQLARTIEAHGITTLWLTAGLFHLIVDEGLKSLKSLRQLLAGGDVLSIPHVLRFIGEATNCRLINGYGPTENTTFTCCYTVTRSEWGSNSLPIGTAIANTRVYILDAHLQPVPVGVTGEIYIGGDGLARGYLNRPELTREKFIDAPSWNDEGIFPVPTTERLYKTGDLARYLPDGNIEFSGRIDNQVKIRGFRVETGEIEAVLTQHPAVRETVVVAMNDSSNNKYLVAYVVIRDAISLPSGELRRFSGEKLPEYMIPSAFVQLPVIPLTPNGKIDRSALLQLDLARQLPEKQFVAPRDEWELRLREIWENLLQVKPISIHDDFFSLGGNSLLALRLLARLEKVFQSEISLKALFQLSTIEQLAITLRSGEEARLESSDRTQSLLSNSPGLSLNERRGLLASTITRKRVLDTSSLIMLERSGDGESRPPLFFVYLIGELGKHFAESQRVYNLTVWCQIETPKTFIQALANHYVEEIRKIQPSGPYVIGGYCFGGLVALEIAQQLQCQGQTVSLLILIETPNQDYFYNRRRGALRRLGYNNFLQLKYNYRVFNRLEIAEKYNWLRQKIKNLFGSKYDTGKNNYQREEKLDKQDYSDDKILASMQLATVNYKPKSYWGDVALIFGSEGSIYSPLFPWAGWGKIFKGKVSLELIPGTHTSILKDPDVKLLGEVLEKLLNSTRYN